MESNDYRLERWLAILLSLLFFLPFVARADEIVHPDFYVDEVPYKDGDAYLAIGQDVLVPVRIRVEQIEAGENDLHNGTSVEVVGFEPAWLVRGIWLSSAAGRDQLVGRAADLAGTVGGC